MFYLIPDTFRKYPDYYLVHHRSIPESAESSYILVRSDNQSKHNLQYHHIFSTTQRKHLVQIQKLDYVHIMS